MPDRTARPDLKAVPDDAGLPGGSCRACAGGAPATGEALCRS